MPSLDLLRVYLLFNEGDIINWSGGAKDPNYPSPTVTFHDTVLQNFISDGFALQVVRRDQHACLWSPSFQGIGLVFNFLGNTFQVMFRLRSDQGIDLKFGKNWQSQPTPCLVVESQAFEQPRPPTAISLPGQEDADNETTQVVELDAEEIPSSASDSADTVCTVDTAEPEPQQAQQAQQRQQPRRVVVQRRRRARQARLIQRIHRRRGVPRLRAYLSLATTASSTTSACQLTPAASSTVATLSNATPPSVGPQRPRAHSPPFPGSESSLARSVCCDSERVFPISTPAVTQASESSLPASALGDDRAHEGAADDLLAGCGQVEWGDEGSIAFEEFKAHPSHAFWEWDETELRWFHRDEPMGARLWFPVQLD